MINAGRSIRRILDDVNLEKLTKEYKKETVPKHGLELKIIHSITVQYEGAIDTVCDETQYQVRMILPLA